MKTIAINLKGVKKGPKNVRRLWVSDMLYFGGGTVRM